MMRLPAVGAACGQRWPGESWRPSVLAASAASCGGGWRRCCRESGGGRWVWRCSLPAIGAAGCGGGGGVLVAVWFGGGWRPQGWVGICCRRAWRMPLPAVGAAGVGVLGGDMPPSGLGAAVGDKGGVWVVAVGVCTCRCRLWGLPGVVLAGIWPLPRPVVGAVVCPMNRRAVVAVAFGGAAVGGGFGGVRRWFCRGDGGRCWLWPLPPPAVEPVLDGLPGVLVMASGLGGGRRLLWRQPTASLEGAGGGVGDGQLRCWRGDDAVGRRACPLRFPAVGAVGGCAGGGALAAVGVGGSWWRCWFGVEGGHQSWWLLPAVLVAAILAGVVVGGWRRQGRVGGDVRTARQLTLPAEWTASGGVGGAMMAAVWLGGFRCRLWG